MDTNILEEHAAFIFRVRGGQNIVTNPPKYMAKNLEYWYVSIKQ
jgi:hypothetical protein